MMTMKTSIIYLMISLKIHIKKGESSLVTKDYKRSINNIRTSLKAKISKIKRIKKRN